MVCHLYFTYDIWKSELWATEALTFTYDNLTNSFYSMANVTRGVTSGGQGGHVPRAPKFRGRQIWWKKKDFTKKRAPNQLFWGICQNIFMPMAHYIIYFNINSVSKYLGAQNLDLPQVPFTLVTPLNVTEGSHLFSGLFHFGSFPQFFTALLGVFRSFLMVFSNGRKSNQFL